MPMGGGAGGLPTQQQHQEMQAKQAQVNAPRATPSHQIACI